MNVQQTIPTSARSAEEQDPAAVLDLGVLALGDDGAVRFADEAALDLLGCADGFELERLWAELRPRLEEAGLRWEAAGGGAARAALDMPAEGEERRLLFDLRRGGEGGGVLLVRDGRLASSLEADLRLASQMRSVTQIAPAVAHDLRAPINAMVFNIELLKENIASGRGSEPGGQERLLRYVNVLKEELSRLHKSLEIFLSHISPRGDRVETLDLREVVGELAALLVAPARKQQVQVSVDMPDVEVTAEGNRYLLRQALLHLSLAALVGVPRQGTLAVHLEEPQDGQARLRLAGSPGPESPTTPDEAPSAAPGFDVRPSPGGTLAQLWVAQSILAAHGGRARASGTESATPGTPQAYEVELKVLGNSGSQSKE